jgi:hypothetical protein
MSQYIQGVVDYIPMIQPFQPDFNLFTKVLETKDAQYKAGYDKLSSLYGTLLNSPMSREDNIELRNKFFNDISAQIQKISSLDLSKSQNVEAAYKVFQPLIDNDYILKDMSYTKTAYDEMQRGESLRNCTDPKKCPGQYWDGGARLIQYNIEDFKKARREDTLRMRNPRFVPKVNLSKQAMDYAKEMGFKITLPSYSPDGRYLIHTTNGPNMIPGLADTFMSVFGDDPAAADYYSALSELNRNDFTHDEENIRQYGSQEAAEMYYLDDTHRRIVEANQAQLENARKQEALASNKKAAIDSVIKSKGVDPNDPNDQELIKDRYQTMVDQMISGANAETHETDLNTVTSDDFSTLDLDSKRARIDGVAARTLMQGDLYQAANDYAMQTMDVKMEVDQYALKQFDHVLDMARMNAQHQYSKALSDYQRDNNILEYKSKKIVDTVAELYPNGKKNGSTPNGANPINPGWLKAPITPGGVALEADVRAEDTKTMMSSGDVARANASDVIKKGYYQLKAIIDTPIGQTAPGGIVMKDQQTKDYYIGKMKELFGISKTEVVSENAPGFWENLTNGNIIDAFTSIFSDDSQITTTKTSGGYIDDNGNLVYQDPAAFDTNPDFTNPTSENYWEKVAARVNQFFTQDPVGKHSTGKTEIDPATGQPATGVIGALESYNQSKLAYDYYTTAQANNNSIVHTSVMNSAAETKIMSRLGAYTIPTGTSQIVMDEPQIIKDYTKQALQKMITSGNGVTTYPEFENLYVNSPEARQTAERLVQDLSAKLGRPISGQAYNDAIYAVLRSMKDDAKGVYEEYMTQFTSIYNQHDKAVIKDADKKGFVPLSSGYTFNDSGSGVQADPLSAVVDPAYPGDVQASDFAQLFDQVIFPNKDKIRVYKGLGQNLSEEEDPDALESSEGAVTVLQALRMELNETRSLDDKNRGIFNFTMHPITMNNTNEMAFSFSVSPSFTDTHTGSDKSQKFMNKSDREFTIVVEKDKIPSLRNIEMVRRLEQGPYTLAMKANKRIDLNSFPLGGNVSILPTGSDSYAAVGYTYYMDENTFDIKQAYMEPMHMGPNESLENFAQRTNQMLATIDMQMREGIEIVRASNPNLIKDPDKFNN